MNKKALYQKKLFNKWVSFRNRIGDLKGVVQNDLSKMLEDGSTTILDITTARDRFNDQVAVSQLEFDNLVEETNTLLTALIEAKEE